MNKAFFFQYIIITFLIRDKTKWNKKFHCNWSFLSFGRFIFFESQYNFFLLVELENIETLIVDVKSSKVRISYFFVKDTSGNK